MESGKQFSRQITRKKTNKKNKCLQFFKIFSDNFEVFDSKDEAKNSKNDFLSNKFKFSRLN